MYARTRMRFENKPGLARALGPTLLIVLALGSGCSQGPVDPELSTSGYDADHPPTFLAAPDDRRGSSILADSDSSDWHEVARVSVVPGTKRTVQGSRYTLTFPVGALQEAATITIHERSPAIVDVEFGPHGIAFLEPVTVRVDYSGTNADPLSRNFDGSLPIFLWLNLNTGIWEIVPGFNDPLRRVYTVRLEHFSRYAMASSKGGTAEW